MKLKGILIASMLFSGAAGAEYFFVLNEEVVSKCLYTEVRGMASYKRQLERTHSGGCELNKDVEGTIMATCQGRMTNIIIAAASKDSCETIRKNMLDLMQHVE